MDATMTDNETSLTGNVQDDGHGHTPLETALLANMFPPKAPGLRIPKFLSYAVDLWHEQCMAMFAIHGVRSERDQYYQVLASLEPDVIERIMSYISSPTPQAEFAGLISALTFAYEMSDGDRFDKLMDFSLGDTKPSFLYNKLRRLWLDPNPDASKVLRHIFMKKLPIAVAVTLRSMPGDNINDFLKVADAMVDQHRQQKYLTSNGISSHESIAAQAKPKPGFKKKSSDYDKTPTIYEDGFCFYHHTFGSKAHKCRQGCNYKEKTSQVNSIDSPADISLPSTWNHRRAVRLNQKVDGRPIIVDTGSTFSLLPARPHEKLRTPNNSLFKGAQGASIPVYGKRKIPVDIGTGRRFDHEFFVAGVEDPLLGMDFLLNHRLVVDPVHGQLLDVDTFQSASVNAVMVDSIYSVDENTGDFNYLWREFPALNNASIEKLANKPLHSIEHHIVLKPDSIPAKASVRRLFGPKLDAAKTEIDTMLRLGIIRRSCSDWASPLHVVPKGEDAYRPCGDFRYLNSCTVPDKYPLPHIQEFSKSLHGTQIFSKIDLVRAFHQIPLSKESISKTAMITPFGLFEFLRMPFGLCNAAQAFQRFIDEVTKDLPGIHVYIDDILVASTNRIEHEKHLRQLFARLSKFGLVVNPAKSVLGVSEVNFLGFIVSKDGVKPMTKKVKAITDFPVPQKFSQLSEFLGMINFYHRFLPRCSEMAKPLYDLLKVTKNQKKSNALIKISQWTPIHETAFQNLKQLLSNASLLIYPRHDVETRLVTDASEIAAGAALEQHMDGIWKPVGFYSKGFKAAEQNYSAYDRELLAVKLALQHFRHIIEGIPTNLFHVATDHRPLTSGKHFDVSSRSKTQLNRITRTWQFISELTTDIRHIAGSENLVADALSRNPINRSSNSSLLTMIEEEQVKIGMRPQPGVEWPEHWKVQQHQGHDLTVDIRGHIPRPVIPDSLRKMVFDSVHNIAHLGVKATRKAIAYSYVWPQLTKDVARWVGSCHKCQISKVQKHNKTAFEDFSKPSGKFQQIHVDIVGPLPTSNGFSYLLTIVDRFSRWPVAIPLKGITAEECCDGLLRGWIQYFGTPTKIVTDRGRQFTSNLWNDLCELIGCMHEETTAYHPQANGMVERFHRLLKASLMANSQKNNNWFSELPHVLLAIRGAVKEDLGVSPAQLVFGEPLRLPNAFFPDTEESKCPDLYIQELRALMSKTHYSVPSWHGHYQKDCILKDLETCSHVYVRVLSAKSSLQRPYEGPFKVIKREKKLFTIELNNGTTDIVSADRVKPALMIT